MAKRTPYPVAAIAALLAGATLSTASRAEGDESGANFTKPESSFGLGAGYVSKDNGRFGEYTGQRKEGLYGIVDLDLVKRADDTGTWMRVFGRNLGYDNRELRFDHSRQGNWGYFIDFSQTPHYSPYTINTGLQGIGSNTQTISPAGLTDTQLKTMRNALTLGFEKFMWNNWSVNFSFKSEDKDGSRIFGRGSSGIEFLAEPIHSNTKLFEANLAYLGEKLQMNGGYYGTWFSNQRPELDVFGGTNSSTTTPGSNFQTIGLPPDNRSYQVNLAGGYNFTPSTRGTFKVASGSVRQTDAFPTGFFVSGAVPNTITQAPGTPGNLGGRIDSTQWQLGLSSRATSKLSLRADMRYDDRSDKTPVFTYLTGTTATSTSNGENEPRSYRTMIGKVEASYALPMGFRAIGGVDYVEHQRNASAVRIVSTRLKDDETSYRLEMRRSLSETVNGSLSYVRSDRGGSDWQITSLNGGAVGSNLMYPMYLADRARDKWRAMLDWAPMDRLSLSFILESANDKYTSRYVGIQDGKAQNFSLDAAYAISDTWQATAWYAANDTRSNMLDCRASTTASPIPDSQSFCPNTAANETWGARLRTQGDSFGIGARGAATEKLKLLADLQYFRDRTEQRIDVLSPGAAPAEVLPNINYKRITLRLTGDYAIDKKSGVRIQYIRDHFKTDDWTWTNFVYGADPAPAATDGTTVRQAPTQNVDFLGVSYQYRF